MRFFLFFDEGMYHYEIVVGGGWTGSLRLVYRMDKQ